MEVSNDGSTFTTVASETGTSSPEVATFAEQSAQYIRIVLTAASTTSWWSIDEFTASNGTATRRRRCRSRGGRRAPTPARRGIRRRTRSTGIWRRGSVLMRTRPLGSGSRWIWVRCRASTRSR
ncbi:hypothetical protein GXW82_06675 [Streptacidiphilus sp. 4-A2]|nr:hypothetical protein [Streptacidiphilus sp. 4-A2]